jgi:hypothetical protein|tara:strand:- start:235 stop:396 length:162 start_codon:yes stop_codon:yes gene_type:complete
MERYRLEAKQKGNWIPLKRYSGLSRLKAEFFMAICAMMPAQQSEQLIRCVIDE